MGSIVAASLKPQHFTEQFHRLRAHAGEELVFLVAHGALADRGIGEVGAHLAGHFVGLGFRLEQPEVHPLPVLVHHVERIGAKAGQRRVAPVHQIPGAVGLVDHAAGRVLQNAGAFTALAQLQQVVAQQHGRGVHVAHGQRLFAHLFHVGTAEAHHVGHRHVGQALIGGRAELVVKLHLPVG
ncbi:hypothetical protein D9M73_62720 [compost metagenome]